VLRDDIELLSGRIIAGPLTPALFFLLKDTQDMPQLCRDLNIGRKCADDSAHGIPAQQGKDACGGVSLDEWLTNNAQPVSL